MSLLDPYAGQPLNGGIDNTGAVIGALSGQPAGAATTTSSSIPFDLTGLLRGGGEYYLGQQNIEGAQQLGRETQAGAQALAQQAQAGTEFRPYTVTSGLANVGTTAEGGFNVNLSPEQQALQNQLQGQAGSMFGQVGVDPSQAQAQLFEQMRATQRPEEERQRLALEERMLSQGRLGLGSAAYGGSNPEMLAMETARQEAMARANIGARQQALAEQAQTASLASGLLSSGYMPQSQALSLLEASQIPAGYADIGRRTGAELGAKSGLAGIESLLQGTQLSQEAQLQLNKDLLASIAGRQDPLTGSFGGGLLGSIVQPTVEALPSWLSGLFSSREPDLFADIADIGIPQASSTTSNSSLAINPITNQPYDTSNTLSAFGL